jgi:hypothetical protein
MLVGYLVERMVEQMVGYLVYWTVENSVYRWVDS